MTFKDYKQNIMTWIQNIYNINKQKQKKVYQKMNKLVVYLMKMLNKKKKSKKIKSLYCNKHI